MSVRSYILGVKRSTAKGVMQIGKRGESDGEA